ncbi:MAG: outer membrane beta-barrel family protein [Algibacter sp.]|uniref:outer membrane beta-barrel family protein n=1 Tax=Algibacter sp. TaxID=1872428 RepID=UPI00262697FA|nr:outer membrane beta-barrel family protein [Algibacter sp.]MDG1730882.1 outer membrane beta-barrel family protein [Algibacter sp.]MDG2179384.1 outer membrane beta-barrel family protein [Algibacter sp.]
MYTKPIFFLTFLFTSFCFSQHYTISGSVNDTTNKAIAYANVILINKENPEDIKGSTTNEAGFFKIDNIEKGDYNIKITFLGFEDFLKEIKLIDHTDLGLVILKERLQELDGVTVIAKRPTVKRMVDRLVFNVENTTLSNSNVLDVLKHTPGVFVNNDKITVKLSEPVIYINDRRVHLSSNEIQQLLEGTSASNIKSIEVITNPPAKYEAEGGSVINITTSKNIIAGYNGSVFGNYKQGSQFPKYAFGTSHFFKAKKLNTYLNYSISPRKDFRDNDEFVNFIDNNQVTSSWETDFKRTRETANQNINANIDYALNGNNSLGFSTSMLISPRANTQNDVNSKTDVFSNNKVLDSTFITDNQKVDEAFNLAFTLDYMHKFRKEGEKLLISLHHTNYDFSSFQNVDTDYLFPDKSLIRNNRFQTFSSQEIKLYTGQIDYELPINNSELFEAGAKISNINSENILTQYNFENDIREQDLQNSDSFLYDEINYAAYSSYSKDWDSWSLKLGLRTELTDIKGTSESNNSVNNSDYIKFFPSLHILHALNDKNEVYFNYQKRIFRPRYSQLNPFKYFLNDNSYITGDPGLKPQIDDVFTLGYTFNQKYTFEAYYRYESDPAVQIVFQDNDEKLLKIINTNIDRSITYGLDFTTYTPILDNWYLYVLSSVYYYDNQFFAIESGNQLLNTKQWSVYGQINNYLSLLKDKSLTAEISYLYISPFVEDASNYSEKSSFDISFRKSLWNNRASINLGVVDIFNKLNFRQTTKYLNQDLFLNSRIENRLLTFGFNYKFGNFRLTTNKKEIELNERDRLE